MRKNNRPLASGASLAALLLLLVTSACDRPRAIGQMNNLVVAAAEPVYEELEGQIEQSLEPRTFTVRDERIFDVTSVDPDDDEWGRLRVVRQVMVIGQPEDAWVAEALRRHRGDTPAAPAVLQVRNVWAQNQIVTVVLLPPDASPEAARPLLRQAGALLLDQFERYARTRMFSTDPNTALADSLRANAGFSLLLPEVYYYRELRPGLFVFRNDFPDPSRLIRSVQVDSRPTEQVEMTPEYARAWRAELAPEYTDPVQVTEEEIVQSRAVRAGEAEALEIQGIWSNPPGEWPAAGPYLTRLVRCGARTFLIDAWLYAPGSPKYEYMVQLGTILDSFECGTS